jgi:hypothetical protein
MNELNFQGQINQQNLREGSAELNYENAKLVSNYKNGKLDGYCKITFLDGTIFEGNFKNGILNGKGE